jgi:hypothetical protein
MSREANAAIAKAEAEGMVFDTPDYVTPTKPNPKIVTDWKPKTAPEPKPKPVVQTPVQKVPERPSKPFTGRFEVQVPGGKRKTLSDRTACTCGASLSYCRCSVPTVYRTIVDPGSSNVTEILNIERV